MALSKRSNKPPTVPRTYAPRTRRLATRRQFADAASPHDPLRATRVATVLTPMERAHVDSTANGSYTTIHRSSIREIINDLRTQQAEAVLLSVARYDATNEAHMAAMVQEFPRIPAFALLTDLQRSTPHSVLSLGKLGVRTLIDARLPSGWSKLRGLLTHEHPADIQRITIATLSRDLIHSPADCWRFFDTLFSHRPQIVNVRQLAKVLNVMPTTLISRFYRAKLPSPKQYIDWSRLIRAAQLLENPGLSLSLVARHLEYSSPQAFSRHIIHCTKLAPLQFRQTFTGYSMLQKFRTDLVLPYLTTFQTFHPTIPTPEWMKSRTL